MARPSKPWFRASKNTWYCTIEGRKVSRGVRGKENARAAKAAWHRLMAQPREEQVEQESGTVGSIITRFLADCLGRVKPRTLAWYEGFLTPFSEEHGHLKARALTPPLAEAY